MTHEELKAKIIDLLQEHHPNELERLTGVDDTICMKLVHEIYTKDWSLNKPEDWQAENCGNHWVIFGRFSSGEWIDENGDYLCFDTEEEANQYIKEIIR
jgi:hypothetical protein